MVDQLAGAEAAAAAAAAAAESGKGSNGAGGDGPSFGAELFTPELLDVESRDWATKQGFFTEKGVTPAEVAKLTKEAYAKEKLVGNSIRVPGKDATEEERKQFLDKLGRPAEAAGYEFKQPDNLPEQLPYDGEKATEFKGLAHSLGLTAAQAAGIHDWFVGSSVKEFEAGAGKSAETQAATAKAETEKLVKLWGPLDSPTAQANLQMGYKVLVEAGNDKVIEAFTKAGLLGADKTILSEPLAVLFANIGSALYKEDGVLKGDASRIGNPFADGEHNNMTEQMRTIKEDPDLALSLIQAAGKKPADFGLKT